MKNFLWLKVSKKKKKKNCLKAPIFRFFKESFCVFFLSKHKTDLNASFLQQLTKRFLGKTKGFKFSVEKWGQEGNLGIYLNFQLTHAWSS